jgi:DNA topoisomerase-1
VVKEDRPGTERSFVVLTLQQERIAAEARSETSGSEKAKLFPTDIGFIVNDFLWHTSGTSWISLHRICEKQFDEIAEGSLPWTRMLQEFYHPFTTIRWKKPCYIPNAPSENEFWALIRKPGNQSS